MTSAPTPQPGRRAAARIAGFALIPLISALSPLIVIPALTASFGATTWASVALAQSIGSAAAVVVELGWGLNGPQRVARANSTARAHLYALSLATKSLVAIPLAAPAALIAFSLAPEEPVVAAAIAAVTVLSTLAPSWFFIGSGAPRLILLLDALPRLATNVAAFLVIAFADAPLVAYPILLLLGSVAPPWLAWRASGATLSYLRRVGFRRLLRVISAQGVALQGRVASAAYIALPVTIVGVAAPSALVLFSAAERLQRLTLALLAAFPNALQAWVGQSASDATRQRRIDQAILANVALGLLAGGLFTVLGGLGSTILFSGEIVLPLEVAALCGGVIAITCVSRATGGLGLVAKRRLKSLRNSAAVGAGVGPLLIWVLASRLGTTGALLGEVITETVVLSYQLLALHRVGRRRPN